VVDEVDAFREALHRIDIAAIGFLKANAFGEVVQIPADQVVATDDLVSGMNERICEMTSEKSGGAGDENLHELSLFNVRPRTTSADRGER
jgi:hypothetical protein